MGYTKITKCDRSYSSENARALLFTTLLLVYMCVMELQAAATVTSSTTRGDDLAVLLRSAAMEDSTVIMTFTNGAMAAAGSLLDVFLESFRVGDKTEPLLKHLVIVAMDGEALGRCKRVHPLCYRLDLGGGINFTAEKAFMSRDYLEMMWARNRFQTRVLELGYGFLFTVSTPTI